MLRWIADAGGLELEAQGNGGGARVDVDDGVVAQRAVAGSGIHNVNTAALVGAIREKVLVHLESSLSFCLRSEGWCFR